MEASNLIVKTPLHERLFGSTLFWQTATLITGATTVKICWNRSLNSSQNRVFFLFAAAVWCYNAFQKLDLLKYEISIIKTISENYFFPDQYPWYHEIIPKKLTLGAIPLKNKDHHEKLKSMGIQYVLAVLDPFEWYTPSLFSDPVTITDWNKENISAQLIESPDFEPVDLEGIQIGVNRLDNQINNFKRHSYVHCKAGRGRSATIVICYLLTHGNKHGHTFNSVEEAIIFVKGKRPIIHMNSRQRQAINEYWESIKSTR